MPLQWALLVRQRLRRLRIHRQEIDGCVWYGIVPPDRNEAGRRNDITGNDVSGTVIGSNVGWRGHFDFGAQRWPDGYVPAADVLE
jgi:hypothetical protein